MEFNINRFIALLKRELIVGSRNYLNVIFILLILGIKEVSSILFSLEYNFPLDNGDGFSILIGILTIAVSIQVLRASETKMKSNFGNSILIPASSTEKYLLEFIKVFIVIPVLYTFSIILLFLIRQYLLTNLVGELPKGFSYLLVIKYQLKDYISILPLYSIVLYFSLFKKQMTLLSVVFIVFSALLFSTLDQFVGGVIAGKTVFNILPYYGTQGFNTFLIIFEIGLFFFFQYLSYLRIKEREV